MAAKCKARGFSLIETIFAIGLLAGVLVALAQLVATGVHTTAAARYRTVATVLGQHKMEQLRGEATLGDTTGEVEHLDGSGVTVCDTTEPCQAAVFSTRWSVEPFASAPGTVLIQVVVTHAHGGYGEVRSFAIRPRNVR